MFGLLTFYIRAYLCLVVYERMWASHKIMDREMCNFLFVILSHIYFGIEACNIRSIYLIIFPSK